MFSYIHYITDGGAEDELQNIEMAEAEKDKKNQELKIKKRDYTGYDDEEFAEGNQGMKRTLLSKYDEFLEGPREIVSSVPISLCATFLTSIDRALD